MKPRRRYLAVQIITPNALPSETEFRKVIWQQLQTLYGELGVSRIGFWIVIYHPNQEQPSFIVITANCEYYVQL